MDYRTNENNPNPETQWGADTGTAESMGNKVKNQVTDAANTAKEKVMDTGRKAAERMDQGRQSAARGLGDAASVLHQKADNLPGVEKISRAAHATAEKMDRTASYLRDHDFQAMMGDVETSVRRNPGMSMALAAVAGFLIGRMFRSHDSIY